MLRSGFIQFVLGVFDSNNPIFQKINDLSEGNVEKIIDVDGTVDLIFTNADWNIISMHAIPIHGSLARMLVYAIAN